MDILRFRIERFGTQELIIEKRFFGVWGLDTLANGVILAFRSHLGYGDHGRNHEG